MIQVIIMAKKTSTKTKARARPTKPRTIKPAAISATEKDNAPVIRREIFNMETLNILLSSIILVVLLYSLSLGGTTTAQPSASAPQFISDEASCKTFCEYNPQYGEGEFGGISENGHCLCKIALDEMPNYAKNKTMSATLLIDQGIIIESATITDGVEQQQQPFQMMQ